MSRRSGSWLLASALLLSVLGVVEPASAAARKAAVTWEHVVVRPGDDVRRLKKLFETRLKAATKRAKWKPKRKDPGSSSSSKTSTARAPRKKPQQPTAPVSLSANITRFEWSQSEDVIHVEVAARGRVKGGPTVNTKIRISGRPTERTKLEKEVVRIIADGIVTRLAEIVRLRHKS